MTTSKAIKFRRTQAGRYYANNGADILAADYLSVVINRSSRRGWTISYFLRSGTNLVAQDEMETLGAAKRAAGMVLASRDQLTGHGDLVVEARIQRFVREAGLKVVNDDLAAMTAELHAKGLL